jgi:hypothetical protein
MSKPTVREIKEDIRNLRFPKTKFQLTWEDVKEVIDNNWQSYPLHQGTCDITEVINFAEMAQYAQLTLKEYDKLIDKAQEYFDGYIDIKYHAV